MAMRDCTNTIWLRKVSAAGERGRLRAEQRKAAKINRDDGKRAEHDAGIAPAERVVAEHPDRGCHEFLGERRMHRVEQRLVRSFLDQLLGRRHIVHFIKGDLVRCRQPDHQQQMRDDEYGGRNHRHFCDGIIRNRSEIARGLGGTLRRNCVLAALDIARFFFSNRFASRCH